LGLLGAPALGQVVVLGWHDEAYYRSDPWRGSWAGEGGGVVVNQALLPLDLLFWFMGPVAEVSACRTNLNHPYIEVEDTAGGQTDGARGGRSACPMEGRRRGLLPISGRRPQSREGTAGRRYASWRGSTPPARSVP